MRFLSFRLSRRPVALCAIAALFLIAGCGDGFTGPGGSNATLEIYDGGTAPPFGSLYVGIDETTIPPAGVDGRIGTVDVKAVPTEEAGVLMILVPQLAAGPYDVTVSVGRKTYGGRVTVTAPLVTGEPSVYVDAAIDEAMEALAVQDSLYADTTTRVVVLDSAAFRASLGNVRAALVEAQAEFEALSPDEQAEVVAFMAAHPDIYAPLEDGMVNNGLSTVAMSRIPDLFCGGDEYWFNCVFYNLEHVRNIASTYVAGVAVANVVSWFFSPAGKVAVKIGSAVGAGALLGYAAGTVNDYLLQENFVELVVPEENPLRFRPDVVREVEIMGHYRSLTLSDLSNSELPGAAQVAEAFSALSLTWARLTSSIPLIEIDMPQVPAQPKSRTTKRVPGSELSVGEILTQGVTGAYGHEYGNWLVRFGTTSGLTVTPFAFTAVRNRVGFPGEPITIVGEIVNKGDSIPLYEQQVLGWWSVDVYGDTYQLEVREGGEGSYWARDEFGAWTRDYDMEWQIWYDYDLDRYYFVDMGFFNGWTPFSPLTYPVTGMTDTNPEGDVLTYTRMD